MSKKSKSKKRRQAQKRAQNSTITTKPTNSRAKLKNAPNGPKNATESSKMTSKEVMIDNHLDITPEELESDQVDTMLSENPPREPINQTKILIALGVVIIILLGVLFFFYNKTNQSQNELQKSSQEKLNNVNQSSNSEGSLQP